MNNRRLMEKVLSQGTPITLMEILDAKEAREQRQKQMMEGRSGALISFTLNITGNIKSAPLFRKAFDEGVTLIREQMEWNGCTILEERQLHENTGSEYYACIDGDPIFVKKRMAEIEETCAIGRLFDIDVLTSEGVKISRHDIGQEMRRCLICGESGAACSRSQRHPREQLLQKTIEMIHDYFLNRFADDMASKACRALLYEVSVSPKPGLVDRFTSGAHTDMDFFTFIDSSAVLTPYFRDFVKQGAELSEHSASDVLRYVRYPGKKAEQAMNRVTNHVNTHKGIIFSMGIFCAALGWQYENQIPYSRESFFKLTADICRDLMEDFSQKGRGPVSHGEMLYRKYGISGIRGEAAAGFPSVEHTGVPVLEHFLKQGFSLNDAGALTLLHLAADTADTNVLSRKDMATLEQVRRELKQLIRTPEKALALLPELDQKFTAENISPGGCADLLSLSWMIYLIEQDLK